MKIDVPYREHQLFLIRKNKENTQENCVVPCMEQQKKMNSKSVVPYRE